MNSKIRAFQTISLCVVWLTTGVVWAKTLYVKPNVSSSGCEIGGKYIGQGTVKCPYKTIAEGITGASSGDEVLVSPGTYCETLTITNKKNITIKSVDFSVPDTTNTLPPPLPPKAKISQLAPSCVGPKSGHPFKARAF